MKPILPLLLILSILLTGCGSFFEDKPSSAEEFSASIAYIPLDNRPVNTDRALYMATGAGFELLMPEEDLYRTALDNQPHNSNGTPYGDGEKLLDWLSQCEADYYVISLDQILSGGLVNSRMNTTEPDYRQIDRLLSILSGKKAVIFDTVLRLAPTVGYRNYGLSEYHALRNYGMLERPSCNADATINEIIASYPFGNDGNIISTHIEETLLKDYLHSRSRKMHLSAYLLEKAKDTTDLYLYYGIDDSSPKNTIQRNEINYIKEHLNNGEIFAGTDELGLMSIAKVIQAHYAELFPKAESIRAHASYFGSGQRLPGDAYDIGTLEENFFSHTHSLGIELTETNYSLEYLLLCSTASDDIEADARRLIERYKENIKHHLPTVIIDLTKTTVLSALLYEDTDLELGYLLAYSSWNTAGNAIGIALANSTARYLYLSLDAKQAANADTAFLKSLAYSCLKDISYQNKKSELSDDLEGLGLDPNNFYSSEADISAIEAQAFQLLTDARYPLSFSALENALEGSHYIRSLKDYQTNTISDIRITGIHFPWYRSFEAEIDFKISLDVK